MPSPPLLPIVLDLIRRSGPLTFERFMEFCLYHPEHGYYMQAKERTGVRGDYFTSPDLHPVFARLIARQAGEMWDLLQRPPRFSWVEMGPGRGFFAQDFMAGVRQQNPEFFESVEYVAVEPGVRQQEMLRERFARAGFSEKVRIAPSLGEVDAVTGCFFSNELVDAFPVHVVTRLAGKLKEIYVAAEGDRLVEKLGNLGGTELANAVARYAHHLEDGHRVEMNLRATEWMRGVASRLTRGFVLTIDYGDLASHLYTSDRPRGTLLAYREHTVSEDFYSSPGEVDLTSHVNFSALIDAGKESGLEAAGFTTQERFLLALGEDNGFWDLCDPHESEIAQLQARLKLKRLISPEGMGTIFKVLIQRKGVEAKDLTGLRFQRPSNS